MLKERAKWSKPIWVCEVVPIIQSLLDMYVSIGYPIHLRDNRF